MLELQPLVVLLDLAQGLELGGNRRIHVDTLRHDLSFACQLSPTRQHERVDVKRLGHIADRDARQLAQAHCGGLEGIAVLVRRSRTRLWHLDTPEVRSGCPLNRRNYHFGLNALLGVTSTATQGHKSSPRARMWLGRQSKAGA